jgi:hypothetical protein
LGTARSKDFQNRAVKERLELHRRLVGFDFRQHVAGLHDVAFLLQPLDQRPHGHGVAEFRHFDDVGHEEKKSSE